MIAYQSVFNSEQGQFVLRDLEDMFHAYRHTVGVDSNDSHIRMGERNVVLYIWDMLKVNGKHIQEMIEEERNE